jgi:simple sugar transport system ATP-binding protein
LQGINLKIYPGEIVGVAGISGNGQKELTDLVLGMTACATGEKRLFGKPAAHLSIREARRQGVAFIPENPLAMASIPFMTVLENIALTRPWRYARRAGWSLNWAAVKSDAQDGLKKMAYTLPLYAPARSLSGGNLQRMVIVRELGLDPHLIVASYVTRGLDVQSTQAARQALLDARQAGAGAGWWASGSPIGSAAAPWASSGRRGPGFRSSPAWCTRPAAGFHTPSGRGATTWRMRSAGLPP